MIMDGHHILFVFKFASVKRIHADFMRLTNQSHNFIRSIQISMQNQIYRIVHLL